MDSPEANKIITSSTATCSSDSPPVQESPFLRYASNLSPINPAKAAHVAQGFPGLSSPPLVFRSPRISLQRPTSLLKRAQCFQLSSTEALQNVDGGKQLTDYSVESGKSDALFQNGLIDAPKDVDTNDSLQTEPCVSSGDVDEYLADPVDTECVHSSHTDTPNLKRSDDKHESLLCSSCDPETTMLKSDYRDGVGTVEIPLVSEGAENEIGREPTFDGMAVNIEEEQNDSEWPCNEFSNMKSGIHFCSTAMNPHQDLNTQDGCYSISQPPKPLQDNEEYCANVGEVSDELDEKIASDGLKGNQNQRGMRRCLQFEEVPLYATGDHGSSLNPANNLNSLRPKAYTAVQEILGSCNMELKATSCERWMGNIPQPNNTSLSSHGCRKVSAVSKPSGIGLHLNSIVNAATMDRCSTPSIKLSGPYVGGQAIKSTSFSRHLLENNKCLTSISIVDKDLKGDDVRNYETKTLNAASFATTESPNTTEFEQHKTPDEKETPEICNTNNFDEYSQSSLAKKRKKMADTDDSDGCKRCNCTKSKCLKLYCDCFAAGIYCVDSCSCQGCFNRPEHEDKVLETRQQIESRNPMAFAPKIVQSVPDFSPNNGDENGLTPSSARHKRGCSCKRSMCLKKYCECYQANVGCFSGCRCNGCKNVYGKREEYIAMEHRVTKETINSRAVGERLENIVVENPEMVAAKKEVLCAELNSPHNLSPLTPSFQHSDHGKDVPKSRFLSRRSLQSPESDISILSSNDKLALSPLGNLENIDIFLETSKELRNIGSYDWQVDCNTGMLDLCLPKCNPATKTCHLTPQSDDPSMPMTSSSSYKTRDCKNVSKLFPSREQLPSGGSLRWLNSPVTPVTLGESKSLQGPGSVSGFYDMLQDDTPEILKDYTPTKSVKASSPNKKRVSPPHSHLPELGSFSSRGLRSGRKFILKAVPSFPPLTPCIDSKDGSFQSTSHSEDTGSHSKND